MSYEVNENQYVTIFLSPPGQERRDETVAVRRLYGERREGHGDRECKVWVRRSYWARGGSPSAISELAKRCGLIAKPVKQLVKSVNYDYISHMATVSVSLLKARLSEFLRRVRAGDTLVVTDRGAPVAIVAPLPEGDYESAMNALVEQGLVRPPIAALPEDFWRQPRPKDPSGCCCAAVLQEQAEGW